MREPLYAITSILILMLSISLHEFGHAKFADAAGDPTPRSQGRVTLNPLAHLDPLGTLLMILSTLSGFGIGWGRPVQVNVLKMRNPRWDHFMSVAAGPTMNVLIAAFCAISLRLAMQAQILPSDTVAAVLSFSSHSFVEVFLVLGVLINLGLCIFNLIPIGPLDGHWLVGTFLPEQTRIKWYMFNRGPGMFLFIIFALMPAGSPLDLFGSVLAPLTFHAFRFFIGL